MRLLALTLAFSLLVLSALSVLAAAPLLAPGPPSGSSMQTGGDSEAAYVFRDDFQNGKPQLDWRPFPGFNQDNVKGSRDSTSPAEDKGVGVLTNANAGGFAALSYVDREVPRDFVVETWLYTTVASDQKGALNGVAFRVDPAGERFYRVAALFAADPSLSLAYVGRDTQNYPVSIRVWHADEIPGGVPTESGWHRLRIDVVGDRAEIFWDGAKLPGGPFTIDRVDSGYVGVYATYTGGLGRAETRVDDFAVRPDG